jgi:hypothetical protein
VKSTTVDIGLAEMQLWGPDGGTTTPSPPTASNLPCSANSFLQSRVDTLPVDTARTTAFRNFMADPVEAPDQAGHPLAEGQPERELVWQLRLRHRRRSGVEAGGHAEQQRPALRRPADQGLPRQRSRDPEHPRRDAGPGDHRHRHGGGLHRSVRGCDPELHQPDPQRFQRGDFLATAIKAGIIHLQLFSAATNATGTTNAIGTRVASTGPWTQTATSRRRTSRSRA